MDVERLVRQAIKGDVNAFVALTRNFRRACVRPSSRAIVRVLETPHGGPQ